MSEIEGITELSAWLDGKPKASAAALASRAAARTIPVLARLESDTSPELTRVTVLPIFRALSAALAASKYPSRDSNSAAIAATNFAYFTYDAASNGATTAAYAAARIAGTDAVGARASAAETALATSRTAGSAAAFVADYTSIDEVTAAMRAMWGAISFDAELYDGGAAVDRIAARPLWPGDPASWVGKGWNAVKGDLETADEDWGVWINWYERLLWGRAAHANAEAAKEIDLAYVLIENEEWEHGPAHVNALIKRRIEEIEGRYATEDSAPILDTPRTPPPPLPPQSAGLRRVVNEDGLIDRGPVRPLDAVNDDIDRIRQLAPQAVTLGNELLPLLSPNLNPELVRVVSRYVTAIAGAPEIDVNWAEIWGLGVQMEQTSAATGRQIENQLVPPLEDKAKAALDSLLMIHRPLILSTQEGQELLQLVRNYSASSEDRRAAHDTNYELVAKMKRADDVFAPATVEDFEHALEAAGEGAESERGSAFVAVTVKNTMIVLVAGAVLSPVTIGTILGGAGGAIGGAALTLVGVEALKKSKIFQSITSAIGGRIDGWADVDLRAWVKTSTVRFAPYRRFVRDNADLLRKLAAKEDWPWLTRYVDFLASGDDEQLGE
ncbi:hypothetical protein [Microbaculum marinum]|uniref:DUF4231 domain-containing protein n=1 Tax=Microbaculum marinum TaxID=1764581 RepID=A0AAW9RPS4_9HYPH